MRILRWPLLLALVLAHARRDVSVRAVAAAARHRAPLWPGAGLATVLLVLVSWALSVWVDHVASYDAVYGAFGSLIVIMLWFYLSTIALVIGGFVNGELERDPRAHRHPIGRCTDEASSRSCGSPPSA